VLGTVGCQDDAVAVDPDDLAGQPRALDQDGDRHSAVLGAVQRRANRVQR